jgi:hypothetical protein
MSIGEHIPDAMQGHSHKILVFSDMTDNTVTGGSIPGYSVGYNQATTRLYESFVPVIATGYGSPRTAQETRVASLSAFVGIKY